MSIDDDNMGVFFERIKETIEVTSLKEIDLNNFDNIPLSHNECIFVSDFSKNELVFHKGFQTFLGYSDDDISIEFIRNLYHPMDAILTNRIFRAAILYSLDHPKDSLSNELFISLRIKKNNGSYRKVLSKSSIIEVDKNNKILYVLTRYTDISFMDHTENINWNFKANNLNKETFKRLIYKNDQKHFTKRETEIIIEIAKKRSSKEIADKYSISKHTVATHRKQIYYKCNCHNPAELINFSRGIGIV